MLQELKVTVTDPYGTVLETTTFVVIAETPNQAASSLIDVLEHKYDTKDE